MHDPRHPAPRRRVRDRRDRRRHDPLRDLPPSGVLGGSMPGQRPVGRQAPIRPHPRRIQVAGLRARRSRHRRHPRQGPLPRSAIPPPQTPARSQTSARRHQAHHAQRDLEHAHYRRDLPRPRRRLLPTATHNDRPDASSPSSNASATPSRSQRRPRQPERTFLSGRSDSARVAATALATSALRHSGARAADCSEQLRRGARRCPGNRRSARPRRTRARPGSRPPRCSRSGGRRAAGRSDRAV